MTGLCPVLAAVDFAPAISDSGSRELRGHWNWQSADSARICMILGLGPHRVEIGVSVRCHRHVWSQRTRLGRSAVGSMRAGPSTPPGHFRRVTSLAGQPEVHYSAGEWPPRQSDGHIRETWECASARSESRVRAVWPAFTAAAVHLEPKRPLEVPQKTTQDPGIPGFPPRHESGFIKDSTQERPGALPRHESGISMMAHLTVLHCMARLNPWITCLKIRA